MVRPRPEPKEDSAGVRAAGTPCVMAAISVILGHETTCGGSPRSGLSDGLHRGRRRIPPERGRRREPGGDRQPHPGARVFGLGSTGRGDSGRGRDNRGRAGMRIPTPSPGRRPTAPSPPPSATSSSSRAPDHVRGLYVNAWSAGSRAAHGRADRPGHAHRSQQLRHRHQGRDRVCESPHRGAAGPRDRRHEGSPDPQHDLVARATGRSGDLPHRAHRHREGPGARGCPPRVGRAGHVGRGLGGQQGHGVAEPLQP